MCSKLDARKKSKRLIIWNGGSILNKFVADVEYNHVILVIAFFFPIAKLHNVWSADKLGHQTFYFNHLFIFLLFPRLTMKWHWTTPCRVE